MINKVKELLKSKIKQVRCVYVDASIFGLIALIFCFIPFECVQNKNLSAVVFDTTVGSNRLFYLIGTFLFVHSFCIEFLFCC